MLVMSDVNFCEDLRDEFATSDRTRGDSYFRGGRVVIGDVAANRVTAKVRGSGNRRYDVDVEMDDSRENVCGTECSCPQFEMAGCCKHVWAVLRTLDELMHGEDAVSVPARCKVDDSESREIAQMLETHCR
jgi:uncharacterized Zn finger protein